jgi:hypothetical protein
MKKEAIDGVFVLFDKTLTHYSIVFECGTKERRRGRENN